MKDLILKKLLKQHGFIENDFQISEKIIRIKLKDVNKQELREEGALILNKNDCNYHNYVYPEGLCLGIDQIISSFYPENHPKFGKRLHTIKMPLAIYEKLNKPEETANLIFETNHSLETTPETAVLTVDYSRGADGAKYLVNEIVKGLMPRTADKDDIKEGINYISDLGRLAPLLATRLISDLTKVLLNEKLNTDSFYKLRDRIVNSAEEVESGMIELDINIFYDHIEKMIREESYLAEQVRSYLKLDEKNWILADLNLLNNFVNSNTANAKKLLNALNAKKEPLFISTTSGNHAFAIKVDFQSKTLFIANPGTNESTNCEQIINKLSELTGCITIIPVVTELLNRDEDLPFNNLCTVDSLALAQMMMQQNNLAQGSLNKEHLKTGEFVRKALNEIEKTETKEISSLPIMDKNLMEKAANEFITECQLEVNDIKAKLISTQASLQHVGSQLAEQKVKIDKVRERIEINGENIKSVIISETRSSGILTQAFKEVTENHFIEIQEQFLSSLNDIKKAITTKKESPTNVIGERLFINLHNAQKDFFDSLLVDAKLEDVRNNLLQFRKSCEKNIADADAVMGHGWLYRIVEVVVKAVVGLFAGIGMILGSFICRGLLNSEDRKAYRNTFFKLDQTNESLALEGFRQNILGDEDTQGLLNLNI